MSQFSQLLSLTAKARQQTQLRAGFWMHILHRIPLPWLSLRGSYFPFRHQHLNIWVTAELRAGSDTILRERMFLYYFQPSQNRELQNPLHKGCFLPLHYFETMGEILTYRLYHWGRDRDDQKGGGRNHEEHSQVLFFLFTLLCVYLF